MNLIMTKHSTRDWVVYNCRSKLKIIRPNISGLRINLECKILLVLALK